MDNPSYSVNTGTYLIASTIMSTTSSLGMAMPFLSSFSAAPPCMARIESWDRGTCKHLRWVSEENIDVSEINTNY